MDANEHNSGGHRWALDVPKLGHSPSSRAPGAPRSTPAAVWPPPTQQCPYARISDRTVADEYFRVTKAVEANYEPGAALRADTAGQIMTGLAADHRRLLGNGHCNRPSALDCIHESICERCGFFETGPEFVPVLIQQRDHAANHDQPERARLFTNLLDTLDTTT